MNAAIIIAGGVGNRMHMDIPKQFINIYDKPVIIYTLEGFQRHPEIDQIGVVCLEGWQETLRRYARQYGITKLCWIETGGKTGQESIRNGVTSTAFTEQIFRVGQDGATTREYIPRDSVRKVATPQAYRYGDLYAAYQEAFAKEIGIYGSSYTNTMMVELGHTLHFAAGSEKNIKLTTKDDLELFKAYLRMEAEP